MDFLKKIPLKNLKECATVATVTFVLLYIISSFIMPKILPVIEGATNNDEEGENKETAVAKIDEETKEETDKETDVANTDEETKEETDKPPPASGEGVEMYKVPNSENPPTTTCDAPLRADVCDFPPDVKSAADACLKIQQHKEVMRLAAEKNKNFYDAVSPLNMINNIVDGLTGDEEIHQTMSSFVNESKQSKDIQENESKCNNTIQNASRNAINIDGGKCKTEFAKSMMESGFSEKFIADSLKSMNTKVKMKGYTQEIKDTANQSCKMNNVSKSMNDLGSSLEQAAIQSVMQDLEGMGKIKSDTDSCSAVDSSQTACAYVKSTLCCNSVVQSLKENILDIGCAHTTIEDSKQKIDTSSIQSCDLSNSQDSNTKQDTNTKQKTKSDTEQKASPNYMLYGGGLVALIILAIIGFIIYKKKASSVSAIAIPQQM